MIFFSTIETYCLRKYYTIKKTVSKQSFISTCFNLQKNSFDNPILDEIVSY